MPDTTKQSQLGQERMGGYVIRVKGWIDPSWSEWLEGFSISYDEKGNTTLSGQLADQAALHGLLARIRDLNLTLLSVNPFEAPKPDGGEPSRGN